MTMPKFGFESQFGLAETLKMMGMPNAFDEWTSDFSGMDGRSCQVRDDLCLFVRDAIHKAFVSVDEKGTEAAAATGAIMVNQSIPVSVSVDRPFIFLFRDRTTDTILFLRRMELATEEPTASAAPTTANGPSEETARTSSGPLRNEAHTRGRT